METKLNPSRVAFAHQFRLAVASRVASVLFVVEDEPKEWAAQVEPGVLITFVSLPQGGNDLKRIRFSQDKFNKWQAQRCWAENYDKVIYNYTMSKGSIIMQCHYRLHHDQKMSRERFVETQARLWWEQNSAGIQQQCL